MTIASTTSKVSYNGSGTVGPFPVTFKFIKNADIVATKRSSLGVETVLALTTGYTLTGAGDAAGGALTLTVALAVGESLVIARAPDIVQEVDYVENSAFPAETHEGALDLLTMICQSLQEQVDRAVKVEISSTTDPDDLLAELAADVVSAAASASTATTQAGLAATAKTGAETAQGLSEDASDLAQEWSSNPEDDPVTGHPGEYSAYHWSKKAEAASVGGAVKVSANDTTPGYLEAKVVASTGIVLTTQDDGANETRSIAADVGTTAGKLLQLDASARIPAVSGALLTGITASQISGLSSGMPTGAVIAVASSTVPSGFLECNGAAVSRTTYAALFAAIGVAHGYGDNAATFNLPDYRGRFLRGWDHGIARDPDRAARTAMATGGATGDSVGSVQMDAFKSHTHTGGATVSGTVNSSGSQVYSSTPTGATGGNETRPINAGVMYCIKY